MSTFDGDIVDKSGEDYVEHADQVEKQSTGVLDAKTISRIRWKTDLALMPMLWLLYTWSFIDRINIGNARVYGIERELHLVGYDYNIALTMYFIAYVVFEIPSNILCKIVGPGWWLPGCTVVFGIISLATAYVKTYGQLLAIRFILGAAEAGIFPGCIYCLTRWYTRAELVFRAGIFLSGASAAGMFAGVLSYAIVNDIDQIGSVRGWRMLFLIEGIATVAVGVITLIGLADSPEKAWFLTPEERIIAVKRIQAEEPAKIHSDDANKMHKQAVKQGLFNINAYLIGLSALLCSIILQGLAVFLPTIISGLYPRDKPVIRNLRSAPPWSVGFVWTLLIPFLSWKTGGYRGYWSLGTCLPLIIIGFGLFLGGKTPGARYAGDFFVAPGSAALGGMLQAWGAVNFAPDAARAAGIGVVTLMLNTGGLLSTWVYLPKDAPLYKRGHTASISVAIVIVIVHIITLAYMHWENKQRALGKRDYRLEGLTEEEVASLGHKHPKFRYGY